MYRYQLETMPSLIGGSLLTGLRSLLSYYNFMQHFYMDGARTAAATIETTKYQNRVKEGGKWVAVGTIMSITLRRFHPKIPD